MPYITSSWGDGFVDGVQQGPLINTPAMEKVILPLNLT